MSPSPDPDPDNSDLSSTMMGSTQDPTYHPLGQEDTEGVKGIYSFESC